MFMSLREKNDLKIYIIRIIKYFFIIISAV